MFGHSPLLPVNLLFDLSSDQWRNYQNYVTTWQGDTRQAYDVESSNIQQLSARSKAYYDRKTSSAVLLPGDCILVRNLSERGEPGATLPRRERLSPKTLTCSQLGVSAWAPMPKPSSKLDTSPSGDTSPIKSWQTGLYLMALTQKVMPFTPQL